MNFKPGDIVQDWGMIEDYSYDYICEVGPCYLTNVYFNDIFDVFLTQTDTIDLEDSDLIIYTDVFRQWNY